MIDLAILPRPLRYWRARMVKDGPWIPVLTFFGAPIIDGEEQDRSPRWQALVRTEKTGRAILGESHLPIDIDGVQLRNVESVTQEAYEYMVAHTEWAVKYASSHPEASPQKAVDVRGKSVW